MRQTRTTGPEDCDHVCVSLVKAELVSEERPWGSDKWHEGTLHPAALFPFPPNPRDRRGIGDAAARAHVEGKASSEEMTHMGSKSPLRSLPSGRRRPLH
jgi:hypothetical protein